jgi:hypothetical protein
MNGTDTLHLGDTLDNTGTSVLNYPLSEIEVAILDAARRVKFGELLDVEVSQTEPRHHRSLNPQQKAFVEVLRNESLTFLHTVVVHNGCPSQIEIDGKIGDIRYRRKIRFN